MLLQSIRDNTLLTVQNITTDSSSQSDSTLFSNILEEQTKTKAEYTNGRFGINTNDKGIPNQVSYFDESGNLLSTSNFDAKQILEITNKYSIPMDDLKGLGEQLDAAGIGYRPYELYSGTGSDAGIDFSDLIAGGLGTAYDWTKDVNAKLKDSFLVGTGVENQASKIVEENKKLADSLGIVKNSNITTEKGIDSSYFTALNGRTFVVKNGQVASWYSTKAEAQKYQNENGGVIIDTNKQNTLDLNSSYLSSEYLLNTYISKAKTQNTTTHTLSDLLNI